MSRKPGRLPIAEAHATRVAWWAAFLATLALVALLGMARSAQASATPPAGVLTFDLIEELDGEGESEAEESEGEIEGSCAEETEEVEGCEAEASQEGPQECLLSSVDATVLTKPASDRVRLVVRYSTFSPATVGVALSLRGGKGSLNLGTDTARFGRSGVFRQTAHLSEKQMAKVVVATEFRVRVRAVNTPSYCHRFFDRRLTGKRHRGSSLIWTDSSSS
jgi:hypothetical protein